MTALRTVVLVVIAASVVLAGCSAGPTDGSGNGATAEEVKADALEAMNDTETYVVSMNEERSVRARFDQQASIQGEKHVDREARRLRVEQTTTSGGRSVVVESYLVDRTLYQRSDAFTRQYGSEWVKIDASENFSTTWRALDTLERHERVLDVSEVRLNGTRTVDGTEYHVLEADPRPDDLEAMLAELLGGPNAPITEDDMDVQAASFTYWIDTETNRPARVAGQLNSTYTLQNQEVQLNQTFEFRYREYGSTVAIDLPDGAEDGVAVGEGLIRADRTRAGVA